MKKFEEEIRKVFEKLKNKESFSLSKYADAEWIVMNNTPIDTGEIDYKADESSQFYREKLIESFKYQNSNYIVGISCECCQGQDHFKMKEFSGQPEENLTYANIFVNSNYQFYKDNFIPEYSNHEVHLIANEKSKIENLPFKIEKFYPVGNTAFIKNYELIEEINNMQLKNKLFLFCCGAFGNLLAHQLFKNNPNNIYLDIGSTLNPWLQSEGFKRDYYCGGAFGSRSCFWR